jgi:hypothetical protein
MHHHAHNSLPEEYQKTCDSLAGEWTQSLWSTLHIYHLVVDGAGIREAASSLYEAVFLLHCAFLAKAPTPTIIHRSNTDTLDDYVQLVGRDDEEGVIKLFSVRSRPGICCCCVYHLLCSMAVCHALIPATRCFLASSLVTQ